MSLALVSLTGAYDLKSRRINVIENLNKNLQLIFLDQLASSINDLPEGEKDFLLKIIILMQTTANTLSYSFAFLCFHH